MAGAEGAHDLMPKGAPDNRSAGVNSYSSACTGGMSWVGRIAGAGLAWPTVDGAVASGGFRCAAAACCGG